MRDLAFVLRERVRRAGEQERKDESGAAHTPELARSRLRCN
jgi:hypothetical protein